MQENQEIHIGKEIQKVLKTKQRSVAWLALQVTCDRGNLYKHLQNNHIYPELLLKISIALQVDFFTHYSFFLSKHL